MDDLTLMQQDEKRMADAATMNLRLFDGNPEQVTIAVDKARETGLPLQWVLDSDNAEMGAPLSATDFHPKFQKLIAQNPDRVPTYRDQLKELNALARATAQADMPPEAREAELQKQYAERGVPYPMRVSLAQRGYKELSSGAYLADGKVVHAPVAREELCGAEELKQIDSWMGTLRKQVKLDFSELEGFAAITPAGKRELLGRIMTHYEKRVAAMQAMTENYLDWNNFSDEVLGRRLDRIGILRDIDLSDIDPASLRKGGMGEVDYLEAVNVLGVRDLYKAVTNLSPEELAAVGEDSPIGDQMKKLDYLARQSLDLRGRTTAGQIATVLVNMVPYIGGIAATGPLAAVGKGAAKVGLGLAVKNTLKEGFKGGLKGLATTGGLKTAANSVGKAAGLVFAGEARRLPAFLPQNVLQAYNEWQGGPVYYLNDGVKVALPDKTRDELATLIVRNALQTYMGNTSEWGGEFMPGINPARYIPKKWSSAVVQRFISDISQDKTKYTLFRNALEGSIPLQGTLPEIVEEWINNGMERASTLGYEITGLPFLDMRRDSVFGDLEENTVIAVSSLIGSTGGKVLRLPSRVDHFRKLARFVDTHRGMVDAMEKTKMIQRSPVQAKEFLESVRGGDTTLEVDPEDANTLMQRDPDFAASVGITADTIALAQSQGLPLPVSQNQLLVEQAKNPANKQTGEELLGMVRRNGVSVKEALAADMGEEAVSAFTEQRERIGHFTTKIYTACEVAARSAGVSRQAVQGYSTMAAFLVNHLSQHSTVDGEVEAALDALTVEFIESPEAFAAQKTPPVIQKVLEATIPPELPVDVKTELPAAPAEAGAEPLVASNREQLLESLDDALLVEWQPRLEKVVAAVQRKFSGLAIDDGDLMHELYLGLARAKTGYKESSGKSFKNYANTVLSNAVKNFTLAASKRQEGFSSLNEEVGEDGATRQDFIADAAPDKRAQGEEGEYKAAQLRAMGKVLATLSPEDRKFFVAITLEKKTRAAVAEERGTTRPNEGQRYQRISQRIKLAAEAEMQTLYQSAYAGRLIFVDVKDIKNLGADARLNPEQEHTIHQDENSGATRGAIHFAADFNQSFNAVVTLFGAANASTLPHETAHWVKRMMEALVASGHADEQLTHELATINTWLDRQTYEAEPETAGYAVEREELFARAFEAYIQTGKVPASGVDAAFSTLKRYLMAIYKYVRALPEAFGFQLDPEIIQVFESMLSTDALVARESPLREAVDVLRETYQGLLGLSQDEAKDFIRLIRDADAQMTAAIERRKKKLLPPLRKQWTEQAGESMKSLQVYQTWSGVVEAGGMDYRSLVVMVGKDTAKALRAIGLTGMVNADGADIPLLAEKFGYASPEAMIAELLNTSTPKDFTAQYLAKQEEKFHADLNMDEEAMSAGATIRTLDRLAELLAEKGGIEGYNLRKSELLLHAQHEISVMSVKDILNDRRHINAIKDLNKKLVKAISKKDFASSLALAENIRRNLIVLREKADAKKRIDKTRKLLRRAGAAKRGAIYGSHHEGLKELAFYFGFSKRHADPHPGKPTFREQAVATRSDAELFGDSFDWPQFLLREEVGAFQVLEYADFEELADFAGFLYGEGRELVKEAKGTFAARVEDRVSACTETLGKQALEYAARQEKTPGKPKVKYDDRQDKTLWEKTRAFTRSFLHFGENLNTFLGRADQFSHMGEQGVRGPNLQLRDLLAAAESRAIELTEAAKDPCAAAIKALDKSTGNMKMPQVKFTGDGLLYGYSKWTREMVIAACLNMGNDINRQRLMDGYGWKDGDLAEIASCLTLADWRNIQAIWGALGGKLQEAVSQTFLEENHYQMKLVPAAAFSVAPADGDGSITVEGGYYPIKYVHRTKGADIALGYSPRKLHADVSSTHRRAEHLKNPDPVKLSLLVPLQHIQEAARYAATRMACREVLGVVRDSRYETAFGTTQSFEVYHQMMAILKHIANPAKMEQEVTDGFIAWGRTTLVSTALMGNLRTVLMQGASATVGANELGSYYADSLAAFASHPVDFIAEVRSQSAMMAHRAEYFDRDLRDAVNRMVDSPAEKVRKGFAKAGYFLMRQADAAVASVGWYGKYMQATSRLAAEGVDPDLIEAKAVAQADDFVARTQGAARTLDMTPIQLDRIGRLLSPFITATGAQYNTMLETIGAVKNERLSPEEAFGAIMANIIAPALFQALLGGLVAGLIYGFSGDDDDAIDRANKAMLRELLTSPFSGLPLGRDVIGGLVLTGVDAAIGGKAGYQGALLDAGALGAAAEILQKATISAPKAVVDGNWARAAWLWADAISSATHTPAIRIYTKAKKMYENNGGELPEFLQTIDDAVKAQPKKGTHK